MKTDTSDHVSVVDSRWVGELPGETVKQLQLLVHDARKPEQEMEWINAGLAGTVWPSAVLKFYLDNMVIRREEMVDSDRIRTIFQRLVDGRDHMREGKDLLRIVGFLGVDWQQWMNMLSELIERDEKLLKDIHILADDKVDPRKSDVESEGTNVNFMNNNRDTENNVSFGKRNGESIVSAKANPDDPKPAAELTQARVVSLTPEIVGDSSVDYEVEIAVESDREPNKRSVMKCCYLKSFERCCARNEVFLCEVIFSDDGDKHVETVLKLEDLQSLAPELLIKFLQKRLENKEVDEDPSSEELEDS